MLKDHPSSAIVAVRDIARARTFYRDTLGLDEEAGSMGRVAAFRTGATKLIVYESAQAGTNRANAVVWTVGEDIEAIVRTLRNKGVAFEIYPEIGEYRDGIHHVGRMRLVWLKDPDGNILHLNDI